MPRIIIKEKIDQLKIAPAILLLLLSGRQLISGSFGFLSTPFLARNWHSRVKPITTEKAKIRFKMFSFITLFSLLNSRLSTIFKRRLPCQ